MSFTAEERLRYARQLALPEVGEDGQHRLAGGRVLLVGAGGLGSPAALYLVAAGIGTLGVIDPDVVDVSNLQRQVLYVSAEVGKSKAQAAVARLRAMNPNVQVDPLNERLAPANADDVIERYDFVVDATDNFTAKFLIADACHRTSTAYSHAGIAGFRGQTMTVLPGRTCCYRCVFEDVPPDDGSAPRGPFGAVPGVVGSIQATEALKYVMGIGELLTDALLTYDAETMQFRRVELKRNPYCSLCGQNLREGT